MMRPVILTRRSRAAAVLLGVVAIGGGGGGGCASTKPQGDAGFHDVRATLAERGVSHVEWNTGSADDSRATDAVHALLARELTADDAVQVALLNNRRLQATF